MKLSFLAVCSAVIVSGNGVRADEVVAPLVDKEDSSYWARLMQETDMSVAPTEAPPTGEPPTPEPPTEAPPTGEPPTAPPTAAPRVCECDVEITCETEDGIECNEFSIPTLSCPSDVTSARFLYTGGSCDDTMNPQEGDTCLDTNGGPPADTEVLVTCSSDTAVLAQESVSPGGTIEVSTDPETLPEIMTCIVTTTDEGTVYQEVQFNTQVAFTAKSIFGSLEVEQCGDLDCIVEVTYTYTATNAGEAPINITSMTRTRDEETVDLTDLVDPKELDVGESTIVTEPDDVDYCVTQVISTRVDISSDGEMCAVNLSRRGLLRNTEDTMEGKTVTGVGYYQVNVKK